MNKLRSLSLLAVLLTALLLPASVHAAPQAAPTKDDVVIFGREYTLPAGQTIDGSLVSFGSDVTIEAGASITEDFIAFGSDITMNGELGGDLVAFGSQLSLGATASVGGDLIGPGTSWERHSAAQINGDIVTDEFHVNLPEFSFGDALDFDPPRVNLGSSGNFDFGRGHGHDATWILFRAFAVSTLALLVMLFLPQQTRRVQQAALAEPVAAMGFGLLGLILLPVVLILVLITIIGAPIIAILAGVGLIFGWIALGLEVGQRLAGAFEQDWNDAVEAWVGTFVLSLVLGFIFWVPCIGWLAGLMVSALGFGAVMLSRFGTMDYGRAEVVDAPAEPAKKTTKKSSSKK